jgi:hypothetical protein
MTAPMVGGPGTTAAGVPWNLTVNPNEAGGAEGMLARNRMARDQRLSDAKLEAQRQIDAAQQRYADDESAAQQAAAQQIADARTQASAAVANARARVDQWMAAQEDALRAGQQGVSQQTFTRENPNAALFGNLPAVPPGPAQVPPPVSGLPTVPAQFAHGGVMGGEMVQQYLGGGTTPGGTPSAEGWRYVTVGGRTYYVPAGGQPVPGAGGAEVHFQAPPGTMGAGYQWKFNPGTGAYDPVGQVGAPAPAPALAPATPFTSLGGGVQRPAPALPPPPPTPPTSLGGGVQRSPVGTAALQPLPVSVTQPLFDAAQPPGAPGMVVPPPPPTGPQYSQEMLDAIAARKRQQDDEAKRNAELGLELTPGAVPAPPTWMAARGGTAPMGLPPPPGTGPAIVGEGRAPGIGYRSEVVIDPKAIALGLVHRAEGPVEAQLPGGTLIVPAPPTSRFEDILRRQLPAEPGAKLERRGGTYVPARAAAPQVPPGKAGQGGARRGKARRGKGKAA